MEFAEVRKKFEEVRDNRRQVMGLKTEAQSLREMVEGGAIRYDKDRVQTSPENYQEEWLVRAADLDREADKLMKVGDELRKILMSWLEVCTRQERIVLLNHYINDRSYRWIEYEYADAFDDKTYVGVYRYAQKGIQKISENFF